MRLGSKIVRIRIQSRFTNVLKRVSTDGCVLQMHSNAFQSTDASPKCIQTRFNPRMRLTNAFKRVSIQGCFQTLAKYRMFSDVLHVRIRVF